VAVSTFEADFFHQRLRLPAEQIVVIPNGSNLPQAASPPSGASDPLILSIGRLERYKGHHRVVAALPNVLGQCPNARLRIVGSGPYESALQRLASQLGVAERVEIGAIAADDREGMARLMGQASLVTLLSEYEAHPVSVIEAAALGRPVLVADTSGLSELAARGLARSIPLGGTAESTAAAILQQLRRPSEPQRDLPEQLSTWDDCATELLALYRRVVSHEL
jgi:glycosyltransferase involved in cell wall biosynthesis